MLYWRVTLKRFYFVYVILYQFHILVNQKNEVDIIPVW